MNAPERNAGHRRRRPLWPVVLVLMVSLVLSLPGCSNKLSRYATRREDLQRAMKRFHMSLLVQETRALVRFLPMENRTEWTEAFICFFELYRVADYEIQQIKTGPRVEEAQAVVWITMHPIKSMTVKEKVWKQEWIYENNRWVLFPDSESTRAFLGDCYVPPEEEGSSSP